MDKIAHLINLSSLKHHFLTASMLIFAEKVVAAVHTLEYSKSSYHENLFCLNCLRINL